jgi:hypothetical protein
MLVRNAEIVVETHAPETDASESIIEEGGKTYVVNDDAKWVAEDMVFDPAGLIPV